MANMVRHAAPVAKVHALRAKLLKPKDYDELLKSSDPRRTLLQFYPQTENMTFEQTLGILRQQFQNSIEQIYLYYDLDYRDFLKHMFMRFEVESIKRAIRNITNEDETRAPHLVSTSHLHHIDEEKFAAARTIEQLAASMIYPPYKNILDAMQHENSNVFHVEMSLDKLYFREYFTSLDKIDAVDRSIIEEAVGVDTDMLNLNWIYRAKNSYSITPEEIFNYTLSRGKRFSLKILHELSYMPLSELQRFIEKSHYAQLFVTNPMDRDLFIEVYLYKTLLAIEKEHPISLAPIITYIHQNEYQMRDVSMIVEAAQYHMDVSNHLIGKQVSTWPSKK